MSRDTSFYYSFLVLPPRKRSAIISVWDFCRAVDDAVDEQEEEPVPGARRPSAEPLALWRQELDACYRPGGAPTTRQGRALRPVVGEFSLPRGQFEALIDGVEMDLTHDRYPTFAALEDYCRHVASTVGLICLEIFGYRNPAARDYAASLGVALQLTNIIRDVGSDLARGRIYLPEEDLARFGVTEDALRAGRVTPAVRALLQFECERARLYYLEAARSIPATDARSLLAAEIMAGIYFEILTRIEHAGYDVFSRRIRVPRPRRALIALRIWSLSLVGHWALALGIGHRH